MADLLQEPAAKIINTAVLLPIMLPVRRNAARRMEIIPAARMEKVKKAANQPEQLLQMIKKLIRSR